MGASVLSMALLLNASISHWSNEKFQDTSNGKKGGDACGASLNKGKRIIGGRNATEGEFPWMVAILDNAMSQYCGGSIIKPDIVVTAAHCVEGNELGNIVLWAGLLDLKNPFNYSQKRSVKKVVIPESYHFPANDIALLKLEVPFDFTESKGYIGAICLPAKDRPLEGDVEVAGWGRTSPDEPYSQHLLAVIIPVTSCVEKDENIMFCAGSPGMDSCPLLCCTYEAQRIHFPGMFTCLPRSLLPARRLLLQGTAAVALVSSIQRLHQGRSRIRQSNNHVSFGPGCGNVESVFRWSL